MRTSLELPPALLLQLKVLAAQQNSSLRQTVMDTLERGLLAPVPGAGQSLALPSVRLGSPMALNAQQLSGDLSAYVPRL